MLKAIIIDDEQDAVCSLETMLMEYCDNVNIVGKAYSASEGIIKIRANNPDIVFLDIEMPDGPGFDVLESVPKNHFDIIFITAHSEYAVRAFKYSATDYLLKPVKIEELRNAVDRVMYQRESAQLPIHNYNILMENLQQEIPTKIAIPSDKGLEYLLLDDIILIEAMGSYSKIFMRNRKKILVSKGLYEFQEILDINSFFKVHKSFLINLRHVQQYIKKSGGSIKMFDGTIVPVSIRNREMFMSRMKKYVRSFR